MDTMRPDVRKIWSRPTLSREFLVRRKHSNTVETIVGFFVVLYPGFTRVQDVPGRRHWNS